MKKKKIQVRPIDGQLHAACQKLNAEGIIEAVQSGADINAPDENGYAPLDIVSRVADDWQTGDYRHDPVLQKKVQNIVDILIGYGANPDGATGEYLPLEVFALRGCDPHVCSKLARAGATLNAVSDEDTILDSVNNAINGIINVDIDEDPAVLDRLNKIYDTLVRRGAKHFDELNERTEQETDNELQ